MSLMPGLAFKHQGRRAEPSPLHSDVAGFIGRTRRGPLGGAVRVEGWRRFVQVFGDLHRARTLPYAVRGYFENGGRAAWIVRLAGGDDPLAERTWDIGNWLTRNESRKEKHYAHQYRVTASSPGRWAAGLRVHVHWHPAGVERRLLADLTVTAREEPAEYLRNLSPDVNEVDEEEGRSQGLATRVNAESNLIRLYPVAESQRPVEERTTAAPRGGVEQFELSLPATSTAPALLTEYLDAVKHLGDQPEVAMLAVPGLEDDLDALARSLSKAVEPTEADLENMKDEPRREILQALLRQAAELQDRMLILDTPRPPQDFNQLHEYVNGLREAAEVDSNRRVGAVYHPWLRVQDPLGGLTAPLRTVPPSGHIAGVISRTDRDRGAHHTPANVPVFDVVDLEDSYDREAGGRLISAGINLIRCQPGQRLLVWGGRTLDPLPQGRFLAHRRLLHRLVRTIRRVAEPIVFEKNGPALWLTLARTVTSVLLDAYRAGALKGDRADEAFRVRCDAETNPPEQIDLGRVLCEIAVAPAMPMEFITLRVAFSETSDVEVFEA